MTNEVNTSGDFIYAYKQIPYALINQEVDDKSEFSRQMEKIIGYYDIYNHGAKFTPEGTNGNYIPAMSNQRVSARLINKEARFMFAEMPDIIVDSKGGIEKASSDVKDNISAIQEYIKSVVGANNLERQLLQAAKDCFISGRVGAIVNFNEEDGVTITFLKPMEFVYETKINKPDALSKFVAFITVKDNDNLKCKRIFKKKYELVQEKDKATGKPKDVCYVEEILYDGIGHEIEVVTEWQPTLFDKIPAAVFINDGLLGDIYGESEIENLKDNESWYSKLANADIDSERKSMNPTRYTTDMDSESTKNLSTSPGAYWDLLTDQNLSSPSPSVGVLESSMSYSAPLDTTLRRIKSSMHDQVDIPDISLENMTGIITSGKALKAVYWPLMVRCKEKMKTWGPQLRYLFSIIIDGAVLYPDCIKKYTEEYIYPVNYEIHIEINYPLPDDAESEKTMDLTEVSSQTMSRKAYMKKWRELTDSECDEELKQIALEKQLLEEVAFSNDNFANM